MAEIKSPKEIVEDTTSLTNAKKTEALKLRTESTVQGAFWGGAIGVLFTFYKGQNKYASALIGAGVGALVSNMLTVKK